MGTKRGRPAIRQAPEPQASATTQEASKTSKNQRCLEEVKHSYHKHQEHSSSDSDSDNEDEDEDEVEDELDDSKAQAD